MLNQITVMGRLTKDPELRYTQTQTPVTSFTLAVDRDYVPKGEGRQTDFITCVAWRGTAEFVNKYFSKGSMAVILGRLQSRDWTDKEGNKRREWEIIADTVYFGESKQSSEKHTTAYTQTQAPVNVDAGDFADLDDAGPLPWE